MINYAVILLCLALLHLPVISLAEGNNNERFIFQLAGDNPVSTMSNGSYSEEDNSISILESLRLLPKKDPREAVLKAVIIPTNGHAYADHRRRGYKFAVGEIGSLALVANGVGGSNTDSRKIIAGSVGFLLIKTWELFDAYDAAVHYNKWLDGFSLNTEGNTQFQLTFHF